MSICNRLIDKVSFDYLFVKKFVYYFHLHGRQLINFNCFTDKDI